MSVQSSQLQVAVTCCEALHPSNLNNWYHPNIWKECSKLLMPNCSSQSESLSGLPLSVETAGPGPLSRSLRRFKRRAGFSGDERTSWNWVSHPQFLRQTASQIHGMPGWFDHVANASQRTNSCKVPLTIALVLFPTRETPLPQNDPAWLLMAKSVDIERRQGQQLHLHPIAWPLECYLDDTSDMAIWNR